MGDIVADMTGSNRGASFLDAALLLNDVRTLLLEAPPSATSLPRERQ
jgi:hypothetical protein